MNTTYYKKLEKKIDKLQKEHNNYKKEQKNKFRRFVVFMVALCLIISGITGVASYTLAANQVGYTAKDTSWTVDNAQDAIDELRDTVGAALVGSIYSYMGNNAPFGYLACDGTEYNIADYPRLAEHFTSEFGSANYFGGDGTTTFKVPDLRGEFLRGTGTNSHTSQGSGANVGTHQDGTGVPFIWAYYNSSSNYGIQYAQYNYHGSNFDYVMTGTSVRSLNTGGVWSGIQSLQVGYTTRPTNTSVLYIIKY